MKKCFKVFVFAALLAMTVPASAFEIQKGRVAPWQTQVAPGRTEHLVKKGDYPAVAMKPSHELAFDKRLACAEISVSAAPGSYWYGWSLRRIVVSAPKDIAGDVLFDVTYDDIMLVDNVGRTGSVTLDVIGGSRVSDTPAKYWLLAYPAALSSGRLSIDYYLKNYKSGEIQILTHTLDISSPMFLKGQVSSLREELMDEGKGWSARRYVVDTEAYKEAIIDIIERCNLPSMQIAYTTNLDTLMFTVVNEKWHDAKPGRRELIIRPYDMKSIYEACSISKTPCYYIWSKMVNDGEVDLDTPLYKYYPGLLNRFKKQYRGQVKLITGRMAMSHTSGGGPGYSNMQLDFYPGYHFNYRNSNTCIVQWTIEYLKRAPLDSVAKKYLYDRVEGGMPNTRYHWQPQYDSLAVFSNTGKRDFPSWHENKWASKDPEFWWDKKGYNNNASYHLRTNAVEFTRFLRYYLQGAALSEEMFNEVVHPMVRQHAGNINYERGENFRCLGWAGLENPEFGKMIMHTGSNGIFKGLAQIYLEQNKTLACFTNGRHSYNLWGMVTDVIINAKQPLATFGSAETPKSSGKDIKIVNRCL